jgi:hypothetical protein
MMLLTQQMTRFMLFLPQLYLTRPKHPVHQPYSLLNPNPTQTHHHLPHPNPNSFNYPFKLSRANRLPEHSILQPQSITIVLLYLSIRVALTTLYNLELLHSYTFPINRYIHSLLWLEMVITSNVLVCVLMFPSLSTNTPSTFPYTSYQLLACIFDRH